ncbi:MAG: SseB family protein [Dermatophilaceae bacterium]
MSDAMPPGDDGLLDVPPASDSSRLPWAGRALSSTGFDNDTGEADPTLLARLTDGSDEVALLAAVSGARLLVPIVAAPTGIDDSGELMVERSTEMAVVTLLSPDGQRALPVFSSLAALSAWDASARPSPVTSAGAAQAAVSERCDVLLLDAGSGHQLVLRPSMLWALAQQRDWLPAHTDPFVAQAILRATAEETEVTDCFGEEGDPVGAGILRVVLNLRPGLDPAQVQAIATRVAEQIATDGEARARIDGLAFVIRNA